VLVAVAWLALFGTWLPGSTSTLSSTHGSHAQMAGGRILAVIGRQVGFLNLEAPRPRILTALSPPSFAMDVTAVAGSNLAVISVAEPLDGQGGLGGDLLELELEASEQQAPVPLVSRTDSGEWLGAPAWLPDGSALLFQREDLRAGSDPYWSLSVPMTPRSHGRRMAAS
jgi:hypothetical protein